MFHPQLWQRAHRSLASCCLGMQKAPGSAGKAGGWWDPGEPLPPKGEAASSVRSQSIGYSEGDSLE